MNSLHFWGWLKYAIHAKSLPAIDYQVKAFCISPFLSHTHKQNRVFKIQCRCFFLFYIFHSKLHQVFILPLEWKMSMESLPPALTNRKVVCLVVQSMMRSQPSKVSRSGLFFFFFVTQRPVFLLHPHVTSSAPGCSALFLCAFFWVSTLTWWSRLLGPGSSWGVTGGPATLCG